jgi:hypothetical protein
VIRTLDLQTFYNHEYVIYDVNGERIKIICRKCGDRIADITDIGKVRDPVTGNVVMKQGLRGLTNYTTVQLLLSNGGEMFNAMCKKCAKHLGREEIDALYLSEIQAIERDAIVHDKLEETTPLIDSLLSMTVSRRIN